MANDAKIVAQCNLSSETRAAIKLREAASKSEIPEPECNDTYRRSKGLLRVLRKLSEGQCSLFRMARAVFCDHIAAIQTKSTLASSRDSL